MKTRWILLGCAVCLMLPLAAEEYSPLGRQMETMNDAYKAIRKETDPAKGAALAREAQQALVMSMRELPAMLAKMPEGPEKAKAAAEYRKMLGQCYVAFCEVEQAFLSGKLEQVGRWVASLKDMKKAGHDKFIEEE